MRTWGTILVALVVGQKIALPLFIGLYLWRWGGYDRRMSIAYALGGWVFVVGFYGQIMHLVFHPSWLATWLPSLLPDWLPGWLIV